MRNLLGWGLVVTLVVTVGACGDSSGGTSANVVAASYDKTIQSGTSRVAITTTNQNAGQAASTSEETGVYDYGNHVGDLTSTSQPHGGRPLGDGGDMKVLIVGGKAYMTIPDFLRQRLPGKQWLRIDLPTSWLESPTASLVQGLMQPTDPAGLLSALRDVAGNTTTRGSEQVRDATTTHYTVTIDTDKAVAREPEARRGKIKSSIEEFFGKKNLPVDVWVDDQGRVRRLLVQFEPVFKDPKQPSVTFAKLTVTSKIEYFDFGVPVSVQAPSPDQVADRTQLQQASSCGPGSPTTSTTTSGGLVVTCRGRP